MTDRIPHTEAPERTDAAWSAACAEAEAAYAEATRPERTATAEELADERVRIDLLNAGLTPPRTLHALCQQAAVLVPCGQCWAPSGTPCSRGLSGPGYHVARFARARRRGLLTEAEMARVLDGLDAFTNATVIRDGAR